MFHSLWILNRSICIAFTMPTPAWFEARYLLSKSSQGMFQYFPNAMIFGVFLCAMTVVCTLIIYLHNLALLVLQSLELCWVWFTLHLQCPNLGVLQEGPSCLNLLKGKSNLFSLARIFGVFLCDIRVQLFFLVCQCRLLFQFNEFNFRCIYSVETCMPCKKVPPFQIFSKVDPIFIPWLGFLEVSFVTWGWCVHR